MAMMGLGMGSRHPAPTPLADPVPKDPQSAQGGGRAQPREKCGEQPARSLGPAPPKNRTDLALASFIAVRLSAATRASSRPWLNKCRQLFELRNDLFKAVRVFPSAPYAMACFPHACDVMGAFGTACDAMGVPSATRMRSAAGCRNASGPST